MKLNVFSSLFLIFVLHGVTSLKKLMKPSFIPYCTTRDRCQPACSCEIVPDCEVLSMDNSTRESILFYLNQIRDIQSKAEPQPGGMAMLKYSAELEELSKCWAARCEDEYSECFMTPTYQETSMSVTQIQLDQGEQPSNILWIKVLNYWLGNTKYLSVETLNSLPAGEKGESLRNYAQLMSDQILSVGCAWSKKDAFLTCICTYGPRGPLQAEPIYRAARPCTLCPISYACDNEKPFENLCKEVIIPTVTEETPPPPPPTPPKRNYEIMRSQYLPPSLRFERVLAQRMHTENYLGFTYAPLDSDLVRDHQQQLEQGANRYKNIQPPSYFNEDKFSPTPNYMDEPSTPPYPPPLPSEYPKPVPPISAPPVLPQPSEVSNAIPPPPPLPHFPNISSQKDDDEFPDLLTTTGIPPKTIHEIPIPPRLPFASLPPNRPMQKVELNHNNINPRIYAKRSGSEGIRLENVIYLISLIVFYV